MYKGTCWILLHVCQLLSIWPIAQSDVYHATRGEWPVARTHVRCFNILTLGSATHPGSQGDKIWEWSLGTQWLCPCGNTGKICGTSPLASFGVTVHINALIGNTIERICYGLPVTAAQVTHPGCSGRSRYARSNLLLYFLPCWWVLHVAHHLVFANRYIQYP